MPGPGIDVGDVTVNQGLGVLSVKDGLMTDGKSYRGAVLGVREQVRSLWTVWRGSQRKPGPDGGADWSGKGHSQRGDAPADSQPTIPFHRWGN